MWSSANSAIGAQETNQGKNFGPDEDGWPDFFREYLCAPQLAKTVTRIWFVLLRG